MDAIKLYSCSVFFKLFGAQIVPSYCTLLKSEAIEKINKLRKCICMLANCSLMFRQ